MHALPVTCQQAPGASQPCLDFICYQEGIVLLQQCMRPLEVALIWHNDPSLTLLEPKLDLMPGLLNDGRSCVICSKVCFFSNA